MPDSVLAVIVPDQNTSFEDILNAHYIPLLDDLTPSAFQIVSNLQEHAATQIMVEALLFYPDTANDWQPVWVTTKVSGLKSALTSLYQRDFEQNRYDFLGTTIEKLFISDRTIFIIDVGNYTLISESSLAIESILRTVKRRAEAADLNLGEIAKGSVILNTPALDIWAKQMAQVTYRPFLNDILQGASPIIFQLGGNGTGDSNWQWNGTMSLHNDKTLLMESISAAPQHFTLDRFIPVTAASFSIFRSDPTFTGLVDQADELTHRTDLFLEQNRTAIQSLLQNLGSEVAFVTFAESGPASNSEYLFLRSIQNPQPVRQLLDDLSNRNLIIKNNNTYAIESRILGKLFGSRMNTMENFYLTIYDQVFAIALRNGLAESIGGDLERRRVMYFDDNYSEIINSLGGPLSSILYMDAARFSLYVQPWLYPQNYLSTLTGGLDNFVISTRLHTDGQRLDITLSNFERERAERPFREQWLFPLGGSDLTGTPVFADLTGSVRDEIIFSTVDRSVYVLASDGTSVIQTSTENDIPIGSPVVYDWYGNNQNVIMQAAGDKIYAWNHSGVMLPNFPVSLREEITTPLTVMDFTGNGIAEMIVATADRNIHILNARGQAINGWPQNTNSVVRYSPLITNLNGTTSLFVFAENALHGWNVNGQRRDGFPQFLPAQMHGAPSKFENHLLGAGLDGNLYAVGLQPLFDEPLSTTLRTDPMHIQSLVISNNSLNTSPIIAEVLYRDETEGELVRNELILLQSSNGSLFLYNPNGELIFTQTLGQPASDSHPPEIIDINSDRRQDLVALADFGRLYAWDILSGQRQQDLPTTGMAYPVIRDYYGDGYKEIIAHTRNGLQCWTIYFTRRDSPSEP